MSTQARGSAAGSEARLVQVLEHYLSHLQAGTPLDKDRLLAEHPDLAEDLEACLASLEFIRSAAVGPDPVRPPVGELPAEEPAAGFLGDYRIIGEVGRGGMGVVYEAEQLSLGRRVALKVLPFAATLDPRQLQRFKNEAQAAAQLHHGHIVPVYSVGCERGVHFYAMQFIEGRGLDVVIRELRLLEGREPASPDPTGSPATGPSATKPPTRSRSSTRGRDHLRLVAELGIQAAEALDFAHGVGVLHRDIKPANLLLDVRGSLWITDFGLARLQADGGLTITGDLLGTLRYMSPEQALARRVVIDHRTDIYSLGVTLYELLTLEPVFAGRDRQELLRQIAQEEPRPLRRLNPAVPVDLETIVQKATAKEPGDRYATAQDLADDLRRFLENRTIRARRPGPLERTTKWARRHAAAVTAALAVLVLALVGLSVSTVLISRERADVAHQRDRARQAVDRMYTRVAEQWLADRSNLEPLQREFLEEALRFYDEFAREAGTNPAVQRERARAYRRVAAIRASLGQFDPAEDAYRRAIGLQEQIVRRSSSTPEDRRELAASLGSLGSHYENMGQSRKADPLHLKALELRQGLVSHGTAAPEDWQGLAESHFDLGRLYLDRGEYRESEIHYREALSCCEKAAAVAPSGRPARNLMVRGYGNLARLLRSSGRADESEQMFRKAQPLIEGLVAEEPHRVRYRSNLANLYHGLGMLLTKARAAEAEPLLRQAVEQFDRLAADSPAVPENRHRLADSLVDHGRVLNDLGRPREAERALKRSLDINRQVQAEVPTRGSLAPALTQAATELATILSTEGRLDEAADLIRQAGESTGENPQALNDLAWFLVTVEDARFRDPARAVGLAQAAVRGAPKNASYLHTLGVAHFRAGHWDAADEALTASCRLRSGGDSGDWFVLAMIHAKRGDRAQARRWYDQAVEGMARDRPADRDLIRLRDEAARLCLTDLPKADQGGVHPDGP